MNYAAVVVILAALSAKGKKFTVISFVNNYQSNRYLVFYQQRLPVVRSAVSHGGRWKWRPIDMAGHEIDGHKMQDNISVWLQILLTVSVLKFIY